MKFDLNEMKFEATEAYFQPYQISKKDLFD